MYHLFCNALVRVIYSVVSGQYSYTIVIEQTGLSLEFILLVSKEATYVKNVWAYVHLENGIIIVSIAFKGVFGSFLYAS